MGRAYGRNFLDTLNGYGTMKEYIINNNRTKDGIQYADVILKVNERNYNFELHDTRKQHS